MKLSTKKFDKTWPKCYKYVIEISNLDTWSQSGELKALTHEVLFDKFKGIHRVQQFGFGSHKLIFKRRKDAMMFTLKYL